MSPVWIGLIPVIVLVVLAVVLALRSAFKTGGEE